MTMFIIKQLAIVVWIYLKAIRTYGIENCAQFCGQLYEENTIHPEIHYGSEEHSTVDLVQKQYLSFPYPNVSSQHIETEQRYYQSLKRNTPISTYPSLDLEMVNHYLYQGENGFK